MQTDFGSYTAEQFLDDPVFIRWFKNRSEEDEAFWQEWMASNPPNLKAFKTAEVKLAAILSVDPYPEDQNLKEEMWSAILSSITTKKHLVRPLFTRWLAAASVILIILAAGWLWSNSGRQNSSLIATGVNKKTSNDIAPGGNKAILTLADGSTIILDSAQNGMLSQQGNAKVIKLDNGALTYQKENSQETKIQYNTITTPRGGQYQLVLSDGSHIWLNAASSITYPTVFSGKEREVTITGEAYFEVSHNKEKPFLVSVNNAVVQVLGTHFNVNAYEDEGIMKTTLLEGSVKVSKGDKSVVIEPGQQADVNKASNLIAINKSVNLEEVVAWKNGLFQFDNTDIKNVMRQIGRWYDLDIVIEENVPYKKITGKIYRNVNVSKVLKIMEALKIHFEIQGKTIIVTK